MSWIFIHHLQYFHFKNDLICSSIILIFTDLHSSFCSQYSLPVPLPRDYSDKHLSINIFSKFPTPTSSLISPDFYNYFETLTKIFCHLANKSSFQQQIKQTNINCAKVFIFCWTVDIRVFMLRLISVWQLPHDHLKLYLIIIDWFYVF